MNKNIFGAVGLSVLLLGSVSMALLAHEGHEHGSRGSEYREREDTGRYNPQYKDDQRKDEDEEDTDTSRSSSRRYPPPDREQSAPRERRGRSR